jgi:hypothetical protein
VTVPSELFRNAIDLNRYSTGVARRLIVAYNQIILDAVRQLQGIDEAAAPMKAARLRAILAQLKASLNTWAGDSTDEHRDRAAGYCGAAVSVRGRAAA